MIEIKNKFTKEKYKAVQEGNHYIILDNGNTYIIYEDEIGVFDDKPYTFAGADGFLFNIMIMALYLPCLPFISIYNTLKH